MGHAWCKEKTSKAQDSKSPLDRVFVRCAHRIYPNLKEEGSVLGGATQRVTSSEIGYAGSPPREALTRGRSLDSVDRPFHPSDWVDVNLEVPSTPRPSSVVTNLTLDTNLCPAASPASSCSNLKDGTPVPPPRRRKRNRGRPLPPKPDEALENSSSNAKQADHSGEPLYSSVNSGRSSGDELEEEERPDKSEPRRTKEIYEHKVNGTGKVIPSEVVSAKTTARTEEKKSSRTSEPNHQQRKIPESEEYESFVRNQPVKDSSTPNHHAKRKSKELEKQSKDESQVESKERELSNARPKNYSTVSLPNYDQLELDRHSSERIDEDTEEPKEKAKPSRPVRCSTVSLPAENCLSPFSEKTSVRLEDYIPRRSSIENASAYQVLGKLDCTANGVVADGFVKYDSTKLEDWGLTDITNCELNHQRRLSYEFPSPAEAAPEKNGSKGEDVVDFAESAVAAERERKPPGQEEISDRYVTRSPVTLQKPEAFGKAPSPILDDHSRETTDWMAGQNGSHLRYFDQPTLASTCGSSPACDISKSSASRQPFFLDEEKQRSALDTIGGGSCRSAAIAEESDRSEQSRMIFSRSLSNESEPYDDAYESKELRNHPTASTKLIKTISEESLPREMLEDVDRQLDDFFDEKLAKDLRNKMKQDSIEPTAIVKTPPPSPEPKIKAEILENDHSCLLKVLREEAAEESNLSSMTPSLTELEAALSDMLEKEDAQEESTRQGSRLEDTKSSKTSRSAEKCIEPEIVPIEKNRATFNDDSPSVIRPEKDRLVEIGGITGDKTLVDEDLGEEVDEAPISPGQMFHGAKPTANSRKVSFCAWEEAGMTEIDLRNDPEFIGIAEGAVSRWSEEPKEPDCTSQAEISRTRTEISMSLGESGTRHVDLPPEKPSRLHRNLEEFLDHTGNIPTPPRRKNRNSVGPGKQEVENPQNGSLATDGYSNDRLI